MWPEGRIQQLVVVRVGRLYVGLGEYALHFFGIKSIYGAHNARSRQCVPVRTGGNLDDIWGDLLTLQTFECLPGEE